MDNSFKFLKGAKMIHPTTGITLEYLDKSNAVCFVLFNETREKVILVKQFRPGSNSEMLEIIAGLIDKGEDPLTAAFRELRVDHGEDLVVEWIDVKDILEKSNDMKTILGVTYFSKNSKFLK